MKGILFLQGSLGGLNARDGRPLFMESVAERPLLGMLLEEAAESGCFDQVVFVTSAAACDDPVAEYLQAAWPAVEVLRIEADSPYAFAAASRRDTLFGSVEYDGILSVEGYKALAPGLARDPSQVSFVLDVNDAPLCSRRYFEKAVPLAREIGFFSGIAPGSASLCGFPMRALEKMSGHQRSLRVSEAAAARERIERAMQLIRREKYLGAAEEIEAVRAWQLARAERYGPYRGGSLVHMVRDWVMRHADPPERSRFAEETKGEAISITTRSALDMVRAVCELPGANDVAGAEHWLRRFEQRVPHREAQKAFYPDYPSYLEVELTSRCNLACQFCPQTKLTRPKGDLDHGEFERLLERVGDFVTLLNFSGFGEPTLHPRLFDFVRLAKSRGIPRVEIETNGTRLGEEGFLDGVFESGLDILTVNLDALDHAEETPFGSAYELVRRFRERRGAAQRPFLVLQRVNMAAPGQEGKVTRDFALWYDVADALVIRPFSSYRDTFPDKRPIDFTPLERSACKKLLASTLVLSSGEPVMCEQCFDGQSVEADALSSTGASLLLRRELRLQSSGHPGAFCAPCTQWCQRDAAWTAPAASRLWWEAAYARAAQRVTSSLLTCSTEVLARTQVPEIVRRSGDYDGKLQAALEDRVGHERWAEAWPEGLPTPCGSVGASGSGPGELAHPVACAVLGERLYVTDAGARCVSAYSLDGEFEFAFGETGEYDTRYHECPDIAAVDGELYVAEPNRIRRYAPDGELLGALAPDWDGPPPFSIAPGPPGHMWVATEQDRVILLDVRSGEVVRSLHDPSWIKVLVSASPETGELFVASPDRHELFVYDLEGSLKGRIGREQVGRLYWPVHVAPFGPGYVVSNPGGHEVLILSSSFEYIGSLPVSAWTGKMARAGDRLYVMTRGSETACRVWELERVPAAPA